MTCCGRCSRRPGGAAVAVIAGHARISVAAARRALLAYEKAGAVMRVKGSGPGIPDMWKPAARADGGQRAPARAGGTAEGGEAEADGAPGPDLAVTAEAAATVLAIGQAADEAGKALATGDLPAAQGKAGLRR